MRYKYRYPERELDLIAHCKACKNTKSFLQFHMDDYELLICLNCNKKYPSIFLPYVNVSHEYHEYWQHPLDHFKESTILYDIEDICLFEETPLYQDNLLLEYLEPKSCIKCGVVDDNLWQYLEDNSSFNGDVFYSIIKLKKNIEVDIAPKATCVPCGLNFDSEEEMIDEDLHSQEWHRQKLLPNDEARIDQEQENLVSQIAIDKSEEYIEYPLVVSYDESYASSDEMNDYEQSIDDFESDHFEDSMGDIFELPEG
jgi:Zn ribbon nucleic-acid-binding protein